MGTIAFRIWFFALWDNVFWVFGSNILVLLLGSILTWSTYTSLQNMQILGIPLFIGQVIAIALLLGLQTTWASRIIHQNFEGRLRDIGKDTVYSGLLSTTQAGVILGFIGLQVLRNLMFPLQNSLSMALQTILTLLFIISLVILAFVGPVFHEFKKGIMRSWRIAIQLVMANPGITGLAIIGNVVLALVSIITAGLFPGFFGLALWNVVLTRMLKNKYFWLEANNKSQVDRVVWALCMESELVALKGRKFRNFLFPWRR